MKPANAVPTELQVSSSIGTRNKPGVSSKELQDEEQKIIGRKESFACRDQWTSKEASFFEKVFLIAEKEVAD